MTVYSERTGYLLSGASAEATGALIITGRNTPGVFNRWYSASGDGPSGGASAIFSLLHSHDGSHWTVLETVTASAGTSQSLWYSAGAYQYVRARVDKCYSAAQSGTGSVWVYAHFAVK